MSLQVEKASLEKVMSILEKSTDYRFVYQNSQVESVGNLTLNFKDSDIREVMTECLRGSGLTFSDGRRECGDCSVGRETTGAKGEQERKTSERTGYG